VQLGLQLQQQRLLLHLLRTLLLPVNC
jgi:hypothetical protein